MSTDDRRSGVERARRWALMEWILIGGRRWWLLGALVLAMLISSALAILYADAVSQLSPSELRTFVRRREETPRPYGPMFGRVQE